MKRIPIALLVVALVGCGGGGVAETLPEAESAVETTTTDATTTTVVQTTTVPPTTSTTVDPKVEAGEYYLEIVKPSNCLLQELDVAWEGLTDAQLQDWEEFSAIILPLEAELAQAYVTFLESITSFDWPSEVQPDAQAVAGEVSSLASQYQRSSEAQSTEEYNLIWEGFAAENSAAAVLRAKLGIDTNIGLVEDCDEI